MSDERVSELAVSDEAVATMADLLALELESFTVAHRVLEASVQSQLSLGLDIFPRGHPEIMEIGPVVTGGAADLAVVAPFSPEAYRRAAIAAQDALCL